jgi:WD40 repeat protein
VELEMRHDGDISAAMFCNEDGDILTCSYDGTARFWRASQRTNSVKHEGGVLGAVFADDTTQVVSWGRDRAVKFWGAPPDTNTALTFDGMTTGAAVSDDKSMIVTWSGDVEPRVFSGDPISFESDKVVPSDRMARVWETGTGVVLSVLPHDTPVLAAVFEPGGRRAITCSKDAIAVWDPRSGIRMQPPMKIGAAIKGCRFSSDSSCGVVWNQESAWLWRLHTEQMHSLGRESFDVYDATFDGTGSHFVTCHLDGRTRLWDAASGDLVEEYDAKHLTLQSACFSADGTMVLTCNNMCPARIWKVGESSSPFRVFPPERALEAQPDSYFYLGGIFDSTGKRLLMWNADGSARLWDVETHEMLRVFHVESCDGLGRATTVLGGRFCKGDLQFLTWGTDGTVALWDTDINDPIRIFRHNDAVVNAVLNKNEDSLLTIGKDEEEKFTIGKDGIARLWDLTQDHFVPDERRILEWEIRSGTELNASGEYRVLSYDE